MRTFATYAAREGNTEIIELLEERYGQGIVLDAGKTSVDERGEVTVDGAVAAGGGTGLPLPDGGAVNELVVDNLERLLQRVGFNGELGPRFRFLVSARGIIAMAIAWSVISQAIDVMVRWWSHS